MPEAGVSDDNQMSEWRLMGRAFLALCFKKVAVAPLIEAELIHEISVNPRIGDTAEKRERFRREYKPTFVSRLRMLRRIFFGPVFS
jgi:hypothetical protein